MNIENQEKILRLIAYASGLFTLFVAVIMILGYIQLESIKPLENPALTDLKEQYDSNPNNESLKEQVRALDLMARRAFFATRWQIETGTYLLIIGSAIFIISQRLLIRNRRRKLDKPGDEFDLIKVSKKSRAYLLGLSTFVIAFAFVISFFLRKGLPDPPQVETELVSEGVSQTITAPSRSTTQVARITPEIVVDKTEEISEEIENQAETTPAEDKVKVAPAEASKGNYPFFRGEGSRGIVIDSSYPTEWDGNAGTNIKWKVKVPKTGYSSPIIWGDKLFLTGAEGPLTEVMCFNKNSGELLWTAAATGIEGEPETVPKTSEDTGLAAPTAATNGEVVCAIFATGNLVCLDLDGNRMWAKNLGVPDNHYGHSSSLIIHDNILLVQYDHFKKKSIIGIDLKNGNQLWETIRQVAISWASPVIATFNNVPQVILSSEPLVCSYDIYSGKLLWSAQCMSGEVGPSVGVNSKNVFAVNDFAKLVSLKPGENNAIVWEDNEFTPEVSSPVATEELLYLLTTWGAVACYDTDTGELVWTHDFDYGFYSSPIIVGNMVYMLDQAGVMHIVGTDREFSLISEPKLGERANCTPAFSDGKIYLRTDEHLYCIGN